MILILSDPRKDVHAAAVVRELATRGIACVCFDYSMFPTVARATLEHGAGDQFACIDLGHECIDMRDVRCIWYRRPGHCAPAADIEPSERRWLREECNHTISALLHSSDALWISDPLNIRRASWKPLQLTIAQRLGLSCPRTIVTNEPERARAFIAACPGGVVAKSLAEPCIMYPDEDLALPLYTHRLTQGDMALLPSIVYGPTLLQEYIRKRCDIRVTVIGTSVYAVAIHPLPGHDHGEGPVDFRVQQVFDLPHEIIELPAPVETACRTMVRELGLAFGAIDFVRDAEGRDHFLEINPNGQWLWLEWVTGLPLVTSFCDFMVTHVRKRRSTEEEHSYV